MDRDRYKLLVLFGVIAAALLTALLAPPIPQDPAYHQFADARQLLGIPNFWNVVSNLSFVVVGAWGLAVCCRLRPSGAKVDLAIAYRVFFAGLILVGLGSGYYHLAPTTPTLVWDRLPMAIAFMALFSNVVGEFIAPRLGKQLLLPLALLGMASVVYWYVSELRGAGDLRAYALVQYLPILLIPLILLLYRDRSDTARYFWLMLFLYLLSKIAEHFDQQLFDVFVLSGHTLKHLFAATGGLLFAIALQRRRLKETRLP